MLQLPPAPTDVDPLDLTVAQILQLTAQGTAPPTLRSFDWSKVPSQLHHLPVKQVVALYATVIEQDARHNKLRDYKPYPKQAEFHALGAQFREVALFGSNQSGKTWCAAMETAYHATGDYPSWWRGHKYTKAPRMWVASLNYEFLRDNAQRHLVGPPELPGSGTIPAKRIIKMVKRAGIPDALDVITVRHSSGGVARVKMKSYQEGREGFQGETLDDWWLDEEPPDYGIYTECLTRISATRGRGRLTFTPLLGSTNTVNRFMVEKVVGTGFVNMRLEDALHYTKEEREIIVAGWPEHERRARASGLPLLGSGAVFGSIDPETIKFQDIRIQDHWSRICGIDFGIKDPTVIVWLAHDRDLNCFYLYDAYGNTNALPPEHYAAWRARGEHIPVAWPADALQREKGTGIQLKQRYAELGMRMLDEPAMLPPATGEKEHAHSRTSVEAGLLMLQNLMREGRFKVAAHLEKWWEEFRMYHRKTDGRLADSNNHYIDATRYALVMATQGHGEYKMSRRMSVPRKKYNSRYA